MSVRVDYDILNQKDTPALYSDILLFRPSAGFTGRLFIAIDTKEIYRDSGIGWDLIADAGAGTTGTLQQVTTNGNTTTKDISLISPAKLFIYALSNGGVLFPAGGSGQISQDNTNFVWDNTNKRLGIRTNTPGVAFDVHSTDQVIQQLNNTTTQDSLLSFLNQNVGKWRIGNYYNSNSNDFIIYDTDSGVTRAFFTNTGYTIFPTNMIIGSSNRSSAYGMDVYVSANYQSTLRVQGASTFLSQINGTLGVFSGTLTTPQVQASTSSGLSLNAVSGTQVANLGAGGGSNATFYGAVTSNYGSSGINFNSNAATTGSVNAYRVSNSVGVGSFGIENSTGNDLLNGGLPNATILQSVSNTTLQFGTLQTARLTITGNGRVGIGTTSPADKFAVSNNNVEGLEIGFNTGSMYILAYNRTTISPIPLTLNQVGGNVMVGTTTDNGNKFQVNGSSYLGTNAIFNNSLNATGGQLGFTVSQEFGGTSVAINLSTLLPNYTFTGRALSVMLQLVGVSDSVNGTSVLYNCYRGSGGTWLINTVSTSQAGSTGVSGVSASGTTITVTFNTTAFGVACATVLNRG
jgi:hypothetical protein